MVKAKILKYADPGDDPKFNPGTTEREREILKRTLDTGYFESGKIELLRPLAEEYGVPLENFDDYITDIAARLTKSVFTHMVDRGPLSESPKKKSALKI